MNTPIIAPSLLAGNHARLAESLAEIESSGTPWVHLDIMDGHFVPNLTWGPQTLADLRGGSKLFFDTHLMLSRPDKHIDAFAKAGAQLITVHVEPAYDLRGTLRRIRELGCGCGLAFNPDIPAEALEPYLDQIDLALAMTVFPGFGGQSFMPEVLSKISRLAAWRAERKLNYRIEVDGGVNLETGRRCLAAGADTIVAGTAFFRSTDRRAFIRALSE